jgi:thiosulfate dehydrogenase (quinone) large subunit
MKRKGKGSYTKQQILWIVLRFSMGWIFLWAFLDKLFGLGFATAKESSWLAGNSPTMGFLTHATKGPFVTLFQALAGNPVVDWLFMMGLLLVGVALILGIGVRIAGYVGALMLLLIYLAGFIPPEHNPFMDEHLLQMFILIGLTLVKSGHWFGYGEIWSKTKLVKKYPILE